MTTDSTREDEIVCGLCGSGGPMTEVTATYGERSATFHVCEAHKQEIFEAGS